MPICGMWANLISISCTPFGTTSLVFSYVISDSSCSNPMLSQMFIIALHGLSCGSSFISDLEMFFILASSTVAYSLSATAASFSIIRDGSSSLRFTQASNVRLTMFSIGIVFPESSSMHGPGHGPCPPHFMGFRDKKSARIFFFPGTYTTVK